MSFYPAPVNQRFLSVQFAGAVARPDARGAAASFVCGAALEISIEIENETVLAARFKAAGCGFLMAAADVLCEKVQGRKIREINQVSDLIVSEIGDFQGARGHCLELCAEVWTKITNDFSTKNRRDWNGEDVLICQCFSVSEKTIERAIAENDLRSVAEITAKCAAGGGCGSCQPLITEILDNFIWET